jgi:hypothetical protein
MKILEREIKAKKRMKSRARKLSNAKFAARKMSENPRTEILVPRIVEGKPEDKNSLRGPGR